MNTPRCRGDSCLAAAGARSFSLDLPVATVLHNPRLEWNRFASDGGRMRVARDINVDWKKFSQDNFLFTHCFVPGTMVLMGDGTEKPIEQVVEGDMVVSHTGNVRRVTTVMSREVDEELVVVKAASLAETASTGEHPYFVLPKNQASCNLFDGKKCVYGHTGRCKKNECGDNGGVMSFVRADALVAGDRTFLPTMNKVVDSGFTKSQMRLLGYYVSEGGLAKDDREGESNSVRFHISKSEKDTLGLEISKLMFECFGITTHGIIEIDNGGMTLSFASNEAYDWCLKHSGHIANQKRLSEDVMFSPTNMQVEMMDTWIGGDGHLDERQRSIRLSTASSYLASQAEVIFSRIGGLGNISEGVNPGGPTGREKRFPIFQISAKSSDLGKLEGRYEFRKFSRWARTGQRYRYAACSVSEITDLSRRSYKGLVYNLSVDQDESYVANRMAVHNCSIVASVATEDNGYLIKPACIDLVNNNGNAWTNEVLLATFRTFVGGENYLEHCFISGTRVLMADGTYKEIQDILPGEMIINRLGNPSKVKNIQKRWSDSLVKVSSTDILCRDLFVTGIHPFWAYHARETCPKTGRPNSFDKDNDFCRLDSWRGFSVGVHTRKGESYDCGVTPGWINADDLDLNRDFLTHPVSDRVVENSEINENRAELIGWFLAEGSYAHTNASNEEDSGVIFNLGNDEWDVAERIKNLLTAEFGDLLRADCETRIRESESGSLTVGLSNKSVAEFFFKWCGKYAWAKKLNADAMWLPKKLQALMLKHCLNGDGTGEMESKGYSIELKSKALVQQLLFISWRLGLCPTYRETGVLPRYTDVEIVDGYEVFSDPLTGKKSRSGYGLWFSVRESKTLNDSLGIEDARIANRASKSKTYIFSDEDGKWWLSKMDAVEKVCVGADVFNLEVEDDNSYIAEGVVVHNCQVPELSKGKILDAVLRPLTYKDKDGRTADIFYTDILVATDRKHGKLVKKIASGELVTMSMGCFTSGTPVVLADGTTKAIETFTGDEFVVTHSGNARKVVRPVKTKWMGDVYKIHVAGIADPIVCTGNHPFWVWTGRKDCACGCGGELPHNRISHGRKALGCGLLNGHQMRIKNPMVEYSKDEAIRREKQIEDSKMPVFGWVEARHLVKGSFVTSPIHYVENDCELSAGKARLLGLYLAEGSPVNGMDCVEFSYNLTEKNTLAKETVELLKAEFSVDASLYVRKNKNQCQVRTYKNAEVACWFVENGGRYSSGKRVSERLINANRKILASIVGGWLDGDGGKVLGKKGERKIVAATVSRFLSDQMNLMLNRLGVYAARHTVPAHSSTQKDGRVVFHRESYYLSIGSGSAGVISPFTWRWKDYDWKVSRKFTSNYGDDFTVLRIDKVEKLRDIEGDNEELDVYCLEVEDEHSFLVDGIGVKNCLADWVTCSRCGSTLGDNMPNCKHLDHELMARFTDKQGVERIVAELCGRTIIQGGKRVGDPKSVKFIEASWVEHPAFYGAVLNHYVSEIPKEAARILAFPTERLQMAVDDIFKMRVADKAGMMALHVAQSELARRMREDRVSRIARRLS